jgi:hypothetical protein
MRSSFRKVSRDSLSNLTTWNLSKVIVARSWVRVPPSTQILRSECCVEEYSAKALYGGTRKPQPPYWRRGGVASVFTRKRLVTETTRTSASHSAGSHNVRQDRIHFIVVESSDP